MPISLAWEAFGPNTSAANSQLQLVMSLVQLRISNYRAFAGSQSLRLGPLNAIVGRNDSGKSGVLHALQCFFDPPKRGGVGVGDIHTGVPGGVAEIIVSFDPDRLSSRLVRLDAKNRLDIVDDHLVDSNGRLTIRYRVSATSVEGFDLLIRDSDVVEFFPLALQSHDMLLKLLGDRGLPATRAGKETNQEKRSRLRAWAEAQGLGYREDWANAQGIEKEIRSILPTFLYFSDVARYGIGETAVQNQFKGVIDKALKGNADAEKIEEEIRTTVQQEFDKVFVLLQRLTDSVTAMSASPSVTWRKAVDGIDLHWKDGYGVEAPFHQRGAGVRRMFMLAYFQYEAAETLHDPDGPKYIFAVEEPEVHLHPAAQRSLAEALSELADLGHTVVYTTHSPVFAATNPLDNLTLVERSATAAVARQTPSVDLESVARELGVEAPDRLVGKNNVILVEGPRDVEFYSYILRELFASGLTALDPDGVLILQCGGTSNLEFVVTTRCIDEAGLRWTVLMDSDRLGPGAPEGAGAASMRSAIPSSCRSFHVLERTCIENYLDPAAVKAITGIDCLIPHYGPATDLLGAPLGKRPWKEIKRQGTTIARFMGISALMTAATTPTGSCEWVTIFNGIHSSLTA